MPFSVIIATFGYILNAIKLTHKHINFYKKAQQPGTVLNALSEEIYPFSNISNEELSETNQGKNIKFKVFTQKNLSKKLI